MVYINDIEHFEAHLEHGLGEAYEGRLFSLPPDYLRLRHTGVCAVTSIAIHESLRRQGVDAEIVISKPHFPFDKTYDHVFVVTHDGIVIDASYSQLVDHAGVISWDVARGDVDNSIYPERKIEQFPLSKSDRVVGALAASAMKALAIEVFFDRYDKRHFSKPGFQGMSEEEIKATLREVWEPRNFVSFEATPATTRAGLGMATDSLNISRS